MRKIRIGIDVGGTFTDAVAIDGTTLKIIGKAKYPTTHQAEEGVALGIVMVLEKLLQENCISPDEVAFIAHGTTQATNALLEGDVAKVGILGIEGGLLKGKAHENTIIEPIELAAHKYLTTEHYCLDADAKDALEQAKDIFKRMQEAHIPVVVVSEAFSVDDPSNENIIAKLAKENGMIVTTGHDVSTLYGLKSRTRTAVVNGSLIPRMLETARMTSGCVAKALIKAPLMIMRCDGGVMTTADMETRPILTLLSGLAAGVAGALMYEKIYTGIFLEAGGTSTDISAIKDGRVVVRYAEVGGQKLYLSALDVRTRGIAGGSMIRVAAGRIIGVGPRSAHIANLKYECFSPKLEDPQVEYIAPLKDDEAEYAVIFGADGRRVSLTLAGAANVLETISEEDYAKGDREAALIAWEALGKALGITAKKAATLALDFAVEGLKPVIDDLIATYKLDKDQLELIGGGGSAGVIVNYLGQKLGYSYRSAQNAPIISTIGVALAMSREIVERTVVNPTDADIKAVRREALDNLLKQGASLDKTEVYIEIDKKLNILRAIAMGTQNTKDTLKKQLDRTGLKQEAIKALECSTEALEEYPTVGNWSFFATKKETKHWFGTSKSYRLCVLDSYGNTRQKCNCRGIVYATKKDYKKQLRLIVGELTEYSTIGGALPFLYAYFGAKQVDLTGIIEEEHIIALLKLELEDYPEDEPLALVAVDVAV